MAEYRVCIMGPDGRFSRAIQLLCRDDNTAKEYAKQLVNGYDVELWQGDRKIRAFKHTHDKAVSLGGLFHLKARLRALSTQGRKS